MKMPCSQTLLPALLQKLVGEFFKFFAGKFGKFSGKFGGNFAGFFLTHRTKAQKFRGKFRSIFRNKIRSSKNIFRAKFTLQTCHLNKPWLFSNLVVFGTAYDWTKKSLDGTRWRRHLLTFGYCGTLVPSPAANGLTVMAPSCVNSLYPSAEESWEEMTKIESRNKIRVPHQGGHATARLLEGFLEGSLTVSAS